MADTPRSSIERALKPLPLGSILPRGWLREQLKIQAKGLSGHLDEFWEPVGPNSAWLGGTGESWELGPYYLDGLVPLAYLLEDSGLKKKVSPWVNWTLSNLGSDGWLGPATDHNDQWWPRAVMLKVLAQYAEVTGDLRVEQAMASFFNLMLNTLADKPMKQWAKFRWGEFLVSLIWLCERRDCPLFDDVASLIQSQGYDWSDHFTYFTIENQVRGGTHLATHGVNHAMAVKYPGLWCLFSRSEEDRKASESAIELLDLYHGQATGIFTCDEFLAGKNPSQGTELCSVVEFMFSLETLISLFGKVADADRLESVAYNNLPGTFTADMWAHQYDQQANQVLCTREKRDWWNGEEANLFGLAPNYVCCTANFNQGWPKFVAHLWMATPARGLAAVAYGPSEVTTNIGNAQVTITEKTDYPFKGEIELEIKTSAPIAFPLSLRIPSWADGAMVTLNKERPVPAKPGEFHTIIHRWMKKDRVTLSLPMRLRVSSRYNDAVAVHRGPLTFSERIGSRWTQIAGETPHADYEVRPTTDWNYALIVDKTNPERSFTVRERGVKMPCFSEIKAPVVIEARGRSLPTWGMKGASAAPPPQSPVTTTNKIEKVELIPYGSAKLRITEFPWMEE